MGLNQALRNKAHGQLRAFLRDCRVREPAGRKVLEIGFRNGLFMDECRKMAIVATGIEIRRDFYDDTKATFPDLDVILYDGGKMPVADNSFDYVVSYQVLEHVHSIEHIFRECFRVLKPEGLMYHVCPNYHSFYEGHYKVIWWPFLGKKSGRFYLKLLRCDLTLFDRLNLVRPATVSKLFEKLSQQFRVISLGEKEFKEKFNEDQIKKLDQPVLRSLLRCMSKISPVKRVFLDIVSGLSLYYPLTVIAQKKVLRDSVFEN